MPCHEAAREWRGRKLLVDFSIKLSPPSHGNKKKIEILEVDWKVSNTLADAKLFLLANVICCISTYDPSFGRQTQQQNSDGEN